MAPVNTPDKAPTIIAGMFNDIATGYDRMNDVMTFGMHRGWKQIACRQLKLAEGDRVLDVCTGTGDLAEILSSHVGPSGQVVGIDFSEGMLDIARQRFASRGNITWQQGDALALPFEDNHFDAAIISFGLRNVGNPLQALNEMARVVKPGGTIINLDTASDNDNPLARFYMTVIMPRLGQLLENNFDAYQYLNQSTQTFQTPNEIARMMSLAGLDNPSIQRLGLGSVALLSAQKKKPATGVEG